MPQSPETDALIEATWPDGLSPDEAAVWIATTPERRDKALKRLGAIVQFEAKQLAGTPAAVAAGDSTPTFFRVMKAWKDTRSLASLIPHAQPRRADRGGDGLPEEVRAEARRLIEAADAGVIKESIVRELRDRFPDTAVPITLRKLVASEMANLRRRSAPFGRRILVDSCVLDVALPGGISVRATVDLVIDPDTGLVLALHRPDRFDGLEQRWGSLLAKVERWVAEAPADWSGAQGRPELIVVVPDREPVTLLRRLKDLSSDILEVYDIGDRRTGRRAHAALAGKIGSMVLRPRLPVVPSYEVTEVEADARPPTGPDFDLLADSFVRQHNAVLLASIKFASSSPSAILEAVRTAIGPVPSTSR